MLLHIFIVVNGTKNASMRRADRYKNVSLHGKERN